MNELHKFLHPVEGDEKREIVISKRFVGEDGKPVPFRIRAITQEENKRLGKQSMRLIPGGKRGEKEIDSGVYANRLIVAATEYPDFTNAELCKGYGTNDPLELPEKMLYAGEYKRLMDAIMELSRFDEDPEEAAKN